MIKKYLKIAERFGAKTISRPKKLATSTAKVQMMHIYMHYRLLKKMPTSPDIIIALQATSPIRESKDLERRIKKFKTGKL